MKSLILGIDKVSGKLGKTIFSPLGKVVLGFLSAGMVFLFAAPTGTFSAVQTVNLNTSGTGSSTWNIPNIVPGNQGVQSLTLRNTGSSAGKVTIWLSNATLTKSAAVDPKFGTTPQIDKYLKLSVTGSGITSNLNMPVIFQDFPQSATSTNYVRINRLAAGDSVDLTWTWTLPAATGNDVQGDSVKFDINYMIEELLPPPPVPPTPVPTPVPPTPVPPTPVPTSRSIQIEVPGTKLVERTSDNGTIEDPSAVTAKSTTTLFSITLAPETKVTNPSRPEELPEKIEAVVTHEVFPTLKGWKELSPVFDVEGVTYGEKHSLVMDKSATINIGYDPKLLPECYDDIAIFYFDEVNKIWVRLEEPPGYVAELGSQAAMVNHFSIFCILVKPSTGYPVGPASFTVHDVSAGPVQIVVGEESNIKVGVSNVGGEVGDYKVTLIVNGVATQTKTVTILPLQCQEVYFSLAPGSAGKYQIQVGDNTFDIKVVNPPAPAQPNVVIQKVIKAASPYASLIYLALGIVALVTLLFRTGKK